MYDPFHPAKVIFPLLCLTQYTLYFGRLCQPVGPADGIHILFRCGTHIKELAADTAVYLLVTFLVIAQAIFHPTLDVVGGKKDDPRFILQAVVYADEVGKYTVRQFVSFVKMISGF